VDLFSYIGFEILVTVTMSSAVVWDEMACRKIDIHERIGGAYYLYLQGKKANNTSS
jgi:hypothetical protein